MATTAVDQVYDFIGAWQVGAAITGYFADSVTLTVGNDVQGGYAGKYDSLDEVARILTAIIPDPCNALTWQGARYTGYDVESTIDDYHLSTNVDETGRIVSAHLMTSEGYAVRAMFAAYLASLRPGDIELDELFAATARYHRAPGENLPYFELFVDLGNLVSNPATARVEIGDGGTEHNIEAVLTTGEGPVSFSFDVNIEGKIEAVYRRAAGS